MERNRNYELQYNSLLRKWRLVEFHLEDTHVITTVLGEYITQRAADEALDAALYAEKVESVWVKVR